MDERLPIPVEQLLQQYVQLLHHELPNHISAVYVYGSIALDAFDEHKSDIDFVTIINKTLKKDDIQRLKHVHHTLQELNPLATRMDGMYIRIQDIGKQSVAIPPYPCYADGVFKPAAYWDCNHVTWWTLKQHGIRIDGQNIKSLIDTTWHHVEETMNENLNQYWAQKATNPLYYWFDDWVEFAVLTLCRIEYTLTYKKIVSKAQAAQHAIGTLPEKWIPLITEALNIRKGKYAPSYLSRLERAKLTEQFVKERIACCNSTYFAHK
ncbi:nucleotidyltransferase domain-containing protein [Paenibacillus sp. 481]|uniref:nucleotidyltransferase domain-containing protein n=1 Tax=Paenibacillus sp. 481 TaxID=2835869 RepID=UPI001E3EC259|nr:nucleotidyltransferase domain-containing protein [Paenibacillus sp. 481]UHA72187.1 DUF4111 domain-containing protein [Paenibacillus sp. 481]